MTLENNQNLEKEISNELVSEINNKNILESIYDREITSKKNILECIEKVRIYLKDNKENLSEFEIQEIYNLIYNNIENMRSIVKTNTILHLKNELKSKLGKCVKFKEPVEENPFLEFFKQAYPANKRKKDFTFVLMDINRITLEQIWHTLTHINSLCIKQNNILTKDQKDSIIKMIDILVKSNNIKYINNIRSLETLNRVLKIKVVTLDNGFKLKKLG
jgi:hypothetical protein